MWRYKNYNFCFLKMWLVCTFQRHRKQCPESTNSSPKWLLSWNKKQLVKIPSFIMEFATSCWRRMLSAAVLCTYKAWINLHFNHGGPIPSIGESAFNLPELSHRVDPSRFASTATPAFIMTSLECSASIKINKFSWICAKFITNESSFTIWNSK